MYFYIYIKCVNGFGIFTYDSGVVTQFHTSWTQWKNLFSLEIFGENGAMLVDGLGRSYGVETLTIHCRKPEGGAPHTETIQYNSEDVSWNLEWIDFIKSIRTGSPMLGSADDGIVAMRMLDAVYRSSTTRKVVNV